MFPSQLSDNPRYTGSRDAVLQGQPFVSVFAGLMLTSHLFNGSFSNFSQPVGRPVPHSLWGSSGPMVVALRHQMASAVHAMLLALWLCASLFAVHVILEGRARAEVMRVTAQLDMTRMAEMPVLGVDAEIQEVCDSVRPNLIATLVNRSAVFAIPVVAYGAIPQPALINVLFDKDSRPEARNLLRGKIGDIMWCSHTNLLCRLLWLEPVRYRKYLIGSLFFVGLTRVYHGITIPDQPNHLAIVEEYRDWHFSDQGRKASPLLKATVDLAVTAHFEAKAEYERRLGSLAQGVQQSIQEQAMAAEQEQQQQQVVQQGMVDAAYADAELAKQEQQATTELEKQAASQEMEVAHRARVAEIDAADREHKAMTSVTQRAQEQAIKGLGQPTRP